MSEFKTGDEVLITIKATVDTAYRGGVHVKTRSGGSSYVSLVDEDIKVGVLTPAPPVEYFQPGDVVRHKWSGVLINLGYDGFFSSSTHQFHKYGEGGGATALKFFTSERYEKVEI